MKPFFISVPHAGEKIPPEATWLNGLPEPVVMCDVDRYVNDLYGPGAEKLGIPAVIADIHRYVVDLNRLPDDVDEDSVEGSDNPRGTYTTGFHWVQTTTEAPLMKSPISAELHETLVGKYFWPFHRQVEATFKKFFSTGHKRVFHLDAHSMPSKGTAAHRDPGATRAEIVVSDCDGKSCAPEFKDLVIKSYEAVGFKVAYNWPYKGGRITQTYGRPEDGQHTLQVEMNRALYMDEITKKKIPDLFADVEKKVIRALASILSGLKE